MKKTSVLIPDGESTFTSYVVQCLAQDKNVTIHVVSKDPTASIRYSRFIESFHSYDLTRITLDPDARPNSGNAVLNELIQFHHYEIERTEELVSEIIHIAQQTGSQIIL